MTQAQRKNALADAEARLTEADAALKAAQDARTDAWCAVRAVKDDLARNEPLTKAQADVLVLIYTHDGWVSKSTWSGVRYRWDCDSLSCPEAIRESVFKAFQERDILGRGEREGSMSAMRYPLSDWGKEVAERLCGGKASQPASEEGS